MSAETTAYWKCSGCGKRIPIAQTLVIKKSGRAYCTEACIKRGSRYP